MSFNDDRSGNRSSSANQCYKCNQQGHFAKECPNAPQGNGKNACYKCN